MKIPQNYRWTLDNNKHQNFWQNPLNPSPKEDTNALVMIKGLTAKPHQVTRMPEDSYFLELDIQTFRTLCMSTTSANLID